MAANQFNAFTQYGIGIGLRVPHYRHILAKKPVVDWFEIISENFMVDGGRPLEVLDAILEQYRVVQHGVAMYFGSADKFDRENLKRLKRLVRRTNTVLDPVWQMYAHAIKLVGSTATLLEWDDRIPSFDEVHNEALKANKFRDEQLATTTASDQFPRTTA